MTASTPPRDASLPRLEPLGPGAKTAGRLIHRVRDVYTRELAARGVRHAQLEVSLEQDAGVRSLVIVLRDGDERYAQSHQIRDDAGNPIDLDQFARTWRPEPRLWSAAAQESDAS